MEQDVLESANQRETCATFTQPDGTVLHRQGRVTSLQTRQRWEYCSGVLGQDVSVEITPPRCSQTLLRGQSLNSELWMSCWQPAISFDALGRLSAGHR